MAHVQRRVRWLVSFGSRSRTFDTEAQAREFLSTVSGGRLSTRVVWRGRYRDPAGKERISGAFPRKTDAERWLTSQESRKHRGEWIDPELARTPFRDWTERWWASTVHLRPSSRSRVEGILRSHLIPAFGDVPLSAIRATDVRAFLSRLSASGASAGTVRKVYSVLHSILRAAEESNYIGRSPCIGIKLPGAGREEMRFLGPEQIALLAEGGTDRYRALYLLAGYSGLRFGELVGLSVGKVDFLRSKVTVDEAIVEVSGYPRRGPTKTPGSRRIVNLPRFVTEALAEHLDRFPAGVDGLIFTQPGGGPIRRANFRKRAFLPDTAGAGLPHGFARARTGACRWCEEPEESERHVRPLRFHDLRHSAAAMAIRAGAHPKAIQERLGHASITTTLDRYGHLFPALDEELAVRLDALARAAAEAPAAPLRPERGPSVAILPSETAEKAG